MRDTQLDGTPVLVEVLTRREQEILGLLDQGLSAPEIAQQLTLALSSVKWYIQQIYTKLGVNRRHQALVRARALGLLAAPLATPPSVAPRHNLPMALTRFFGREAEIARLKELLAEYRLVTVTGSGGVGKTRLALHVAEVVLDGFQDGVWLVELASLSEPALVAQVVSIALGVRDDPGRPVLDSLIAFLRQRQALLVLDNCEHLLLACAQLAESLLRACPRLMLLATSREPLGSEGEAVFPAPSLPYPEPGAALSLDQLNAFPSVRLFADRARMVLPDYQVTPANAAALARICQRLDGVPLALEMAAARMNLLTAEQLANRLDDAFAVLSGGRRTALPRQQTLRATLAWSFDLLTEGERLLLPRLSVFAGGCTLEAAEAVCAGEGLASAAVLDALAALVAKSMVIADRRQGAATRYRLLEMVRQYSAEKLQAAGDSALRRTRHRDYYHQHIAANARRVYARERGVWTQQQKADHDNLRLALEWSFSPASEVDAGPQLVFDMLGLWFGLWASQHECLDWQTRAVRWCEAHPGVSPVLYALTLGEACQTTAMNDPQAGLRLALRTVEVSRGLGPAGRQTLMWALFTLGRRYVHDVAEPEMGRAAFAEAQAVLQELRREVFSPEQYESWLSWFAYLDAELACSLSQYPAAKMHARESIALSGLGGDPFATIYPQLILGEACLGLGEYDQARDHFLAALALIEESGDLRQALTLRWLGLVALQQRQLEPAVQYCRAGLRAAELMSDRNVIVSGLGLAAHIAAAQGQPLRAATLSGATAALWRRQRRKPWDDCSLDTLIPGWPSRPDQPSIAAAYAAGQALDADQAVACALDG